MQSKILPQILSIPRSHFACK